MSQNYDSLDQLISTWNQSGKIRQEGTVWPKNKWATEFKIYKDLFLSAPDLLDRPTVAKICQKSLNDDKYIEAFLITMAWGYGTRGYGRYRTRKVLENPNFELLIQESGKFASSGLPIAAVSLFEKIQPKGIKIAYASKYLYFASYGSQRETLILDSFIEKFLKEKEGLRLKLSKFDSKNYETYLEFMESKATSYGIKPGILEEAIFKQLNPGWA